MEIYEFDYMFRPHFRHHKIYLIVMLCIASFQLSLQRVNAGMALFISRNLLNKYCRRDVFVWGMECAANDVNCFWCSFEVLDISV